MTSLRSDAERNRRRVLSAAAEVLASEGFDAPVEAIARAAGVGVGTVYRRFPTKADLVEAILLDLTGDVTERIASETAGEQPWAAVERALDVLASTLAAERGLLDALLEADGSLKAIPEVRARIVATLEPIRAAAADSGELRPDVEASDLLAVAAMVTRRPRGVPGVDPEIWRRWLALVLDGLRAGAHSADLPRAAPPV